MKLVNVRLYIHIDVHKENNKEGPKFKVDDNIRISKYKNILAKGYVPNWRSFCLKKLKILFRQQILLLILTEKKLLECFKKNNCKSQIKKSLDLKK